MVKVEWNCVKCGISNKTQIEEWKKVRDGRGYWDYCRECKFVNDFDIGVRLKSEIT